MIITILLSAFYQHEREIIYNELDRKLTTPITGLLPKVEPGAMPNQNFRHPERELPQRPSQELQLQTNSNLPSDLPRGFGHQRQNNITSKRPNGQRPRPGPRSLKETIERLEKDNIYVVVWGANESLIFTSPSAPEVRKQFYQHSPNAYTMRTVDGYREATHIGPSRRQVVVGTAIDHLEKRMTTLQIQLLGIGLITIFTGFLVGWWITGRSLRPIKRISTTAEEIAEGDLKKRINTENTDNELGQLASVLNTTFARLDSSFDQQIRFTADASHEMRTPIAVILARGQLALNKERSNDEYRETIKTCVGSAQHMRRLIDSLLELSRVDSGTFDIFTEFGNLSEIVEECVEMLQPLADEKNITLKTNLEESVTKFDEQRLRQVIINLLSNAIKYNKTGGNVTLSSQQNDTHCIITISDTGPGIPAVDIPHLFDRFYRADKVRTTGKEGSTGLGLAITKSIVEAHSGSVSVTSEIGVGSNFSISIPNQSMEG